MDKMEIGLSLSQEIVATFLEACMWYQLSYWSSLWINRQTTKPSLPINPTSPCGIHPNLEKILDQCKARKKVITCDNVILQPIDNHVSNCMFNILMTCITTHFHFLHILNININQAPNLQSISRRFCFHVLSSGWVFSNAFDHHFIHTQILLYILKIQSWKNSR
jgi:hypothetical protein